ncbi:glycosyltransferase [Facklamia sp. 7083-14-GEN3]|uniref:glycosyltransferase n=1 Tax=Facklamia sp. 7083-14-GEN3 TaxID=2973478 RepID=UPI00215C5112|nr:glycosyltransferase [Facklamia sp. 7083-14-GEN3]MCR8968396.1 glycosyltransferase [Facklamia sp. 7083-14-GEN3]
MRVLLYSGNLEQIKRSGLGKAIQHQQKALEYMGIDYTMNPKDSFDLLHINTYFPKSYLLAAKCRRKNIPVIYHAHSTKEDFENSFRFSNLLAPSFKQWLLTCYRLGDILITPTPYSKNLLENYGLEQPIYAVSNGIDLSKFQALNTEELTNTFRQKYGYQANDFIVMGIGLYLKRKGILDFVELAKRMPHIQFIWFGYLDLRYVPDEIKKAVTTKLPNLKFAGYVPSEDIRAGLIASNLYIFPTFEETEGIPAIEACAMKADFIVRDIPVFDGWLEDGVNVHKAKDLQAFLDKIQLAYEGNLPSLVEPAYEIAIERDLPQIGRQLFSIYQEALRMKL